MIVRRIIKQKLSADECDGSVPAPDIIILPSTTGMVA